MCNIRLKFVTFTYLASGIFLRYYDRAIHLDWSHREHRGKFISCVYTFTLVHSQTRNLTSVNKRLVLNFKTNRILIQNDGPSNNVTMCRVNKGCCCQAIMSSWNPNMLLVGINILICPLCTSLRLLSLQIGFTVSKLLPEIVLLTSIT